MKSKSVPKYLIVKLVFSIYLSVIKIYITNAHVSITKIKRFFLNQQFIFSQIYNKWAKGNVIHFSQ